MRAGERLPQTKNSSSNRSDVLKATRTGRISTSMSINDLPDELIQHIFYLVLDRRGAYEHYRLLRSLSLTCRLWRKIIDTTSPFRAIIPLDAPIVNLYNLLMHSRTAPLTITDTRRENRHHMPIYLIETILAHSGRFTTAHFKPRGVRDRILQESLKTGLEQLRDLHVELPRDFPAEWLKLLGENKPKGLRDIRISGCGSPFPKVMKSGALEGLTVIHVENVHDGTPPTAVELMTLLRNNPKLESLVLNLGGTPSQDRGEDLCSVMAIDLPELRDVVLLLWSLGISTVLENMHLPSCQRVVVALQAEDNMLLEESPDVHSLSPNALIPLPVRLYELLLKQQELHMKGIRHSISGHHIALQGKGSGTPWDCPAAIVVRETRYGDNTMPYINSLIRSMNGFSNIVVHDLGWAGDQDASSKFDALCSFPKLLRVEITPGDHLWKLIMAPQLGTSSLRASHAVVGNVYAERCGIADALEQTFTIQIGAIGDPRLLVDRLDVKCVLNDHDTADHASRANWERAIGSTMRCSSTKIESILQ